MKKSTDYRITVDEEGDRVIFEDLTNGETLYSGPGNYWDEAELYSSLFSIKSVFYRTL